jgi:hypothetical protein
MNVHVSYELQHSEDRDGYNFAMAQAGRVYSKLVPSFDNGVDSGDHDIS